MSDGNKGESGKEAAAGGASSLLLRPEPWKLRGESGCISSRG